MCDNKYFEPQWARVKKLYSKKHAAFGGGIALANWYVARLKEYDCKCYYCGTSIHDINRLINAKLLKTRKVKGDGKRGPVLEIDKQENGYGEDECVLACYYCNNDKSYTSSKDEYKKYFGPNRKEYFEYLLKQIK